MRIGIDGRLILETGVGRYIQHLVTELGLIDNENSYILFIPKKAHDKIQAPNSRWRIKIADVAWHSIAEQLLMPIIFFREHLDLVHIPYFNIPIFYPGRVILTIHDLTILATHTGKASTLHPFFYTMRRLGYILSLRIGMHRSQVILTVSQTTKEEIIHHFHLPESRVTVTHEGVDEKFQSTNLSRIYSKLPYPYFLYVGNAYPHKNLEFLVRSFLTFLHLLKNDQVKPKLVCVGKEDFFYKKIKQFVRTKGGENDIVFLDTVSDEELVSLYQSARALVFPSLQEGFGLPGLEAMTCGIPVMCSDIPAFQEIYQDAPIYFDPKIEKELVTIFEKVYLEGSFSLKEKVAKGRQVASLYSWKKMAYATLSTYQKLVSP